MYSLKQDTRNKFFFTLRTTVPIVLLIILLAAVIFLEDRPFIYNLIILLLGLLASVYYLYYMFFSKVREKVVDEISGAFTRKYFLDMLPNFKGNYLILISIDNIKEINERYGIENGDRILRKFAALIDLFFEEHLGKEVPIGRFKGGDFLIAVEGDEEKVKELVEEFLKLYDNSFIDNIEVKLFATYGKLEEEEEVKRIIDHLYEELYYCKGRCKRDSKRESIAREKKRNATEFERTIADIIKNEKISIHFQPALNVRNGRYDLAEVIVKLLDDDGNIIHPSQFVPVVNRLGLENDFDLALARKILDTIKRHNLPKDIFYSFNISPYSVRNRLFSQRFFALFEECDIPTSSFVIELYENSIYKDLRFYRSILQQYRKRGFKLAFDNFGSCNASIEYIKVIEVDFIHFDKFFTKHSDDRRYFFLLQAWINAFKHLDIKSVIKFVDDDHKKEEFIKLGVDYLQGYAIAHPMDATNFKRFVEEG
ncbi:MAG: GGDEF domain-containing protein [Epsilonproteobacteria bacterium]|nr:GGDEF domain-containing protein [Campylobacterota bacterium]